MSKNSSRYPFTYACDHLRGKVDDFCPELGMRIPSISRSEASQAIKAIAEAIDWSHEALAERLADIYLRDEAAAAQRGIRMPGVNHG